MAKAVEMANGMRLEWGKNGGMAKLAEMANVAGGGASRGRVVGGKRDVTSGCHYWATAAQHVTHQLSPPPSLDFTLHHQTPPPSQLTILIPHRGVIPWPHRTRRSASGQKTHPAADPAYRGRRQPKEGAIAWFSRRDAYRSGGHNQYNNILTASRDMPLSPYWPSNLHQWPPPESLIGEAFPSRAIGARGEFYQIEPVLAWIISTVGVCAN